MKIIYRIFKKNLVKISVLENIDIDPIFMLRWLDDDVGVTKYTIR